MVGPLSSDVSWSTLLTAVRMSWRGRSALTAGGVAAAAVENARLYDGIGNDFDTLMDEIIFMRRAAQAVGHRGEKST